VYSCTACSYSTARDRVVADLLRELRDLGELFDDFARLALPRLARCATGQCAGSRDPALDGLRDLADALGLNPASQWSSGRISNALCAGARAKSPSIPFAGVCRTDAAVKRGAPPTAGSEP